MAGFRTHIEVASIASAIFSTGFLGAGFVSPKEAFILWAAGSVGGIMPDVDSDNSTSISLIFGLISLLSISLILTNFSSHLSISELWGVILLTTLLINVVIRPVFEKFTVHRGLFHSILGGFLFFFGSTSLSYSVLDVSAVMAWMLGFFVFFGFITHLTLDEIYSVDLMNVRIKRSFGSALKLFDYKNILTSAMMAAVVAVLFYLTPESQEFSSIIFSEQTYITFSENFLPDQVNWLASQSSQDYTQ